MEKLNLDVLVRTGTEKLKDIRSDKMIPWIVYWHKEAPISLKMDYSEFLKTYRKSWGSHLINLKIWNKNLEVLVHQVQKEPATWSFLHIDFYAITKWEVLTTKIHLNFVWECLVVREWAILNEHLKEIEVKCLPKDLVDGFDVDLSTLKKFWDCIRVSDLIINKEKYTILNNQDDIVVIATSPAKIEIEVPVIAEATEWEEKTDTEK